MFLKDVHDTVLSLIGDDSGACHLNCEANMLQPCIKWKKLSVEKIIIINFISVK